MKKYVLDGTVKEFELWNPYNLGYLAGYAAASLASGRITGKAGQTFTAGTLGTYKILAPRAATGPSVVLGPPTVFNKANIKFLFKLLVQLPLPGRCCGQTPAAPPPAGAR